jgi:hypothetical protein
MGSTSLWGVVQFEKELSFDLLQVAMMGGATFECDAGECDIGVHSKEFVERRSGSLVAVGGCAEKQRGVGSLCGCHNREVHCGAACLVAQWVSKWVCGYPGVTGHRRLVGYKAN